MLRAPIASQRACSTASKSARALRPSGCIFRCIFWSWQAIRRASASACPRSTARSCALILRGGSGSRIVEPEVEARSEEKFTSTSSRPASARDAPVSARLNSSFRACLPLGFCMRLPAQLRTMLAVDSGSSLPKQRW